MFFFQKITKVGYCIACSLKNNQIQYMHGVKKTNQIVKVTIYTFHNLIFFLDIGIEYELVLKDVTVP